MQTKTGPRKVPDTVHIPTLPAIVQRINQLIDDPETGTREIGAVLAQDAPLAARVLRIANSAFYALQEPCMSVEQACAVLGVRILRNTVTQAAVFRQFDHLKQTGFDLDGLWKHSILTAQVCSHLSRKSRVVELGPDDFYSCGLLHDIGRVMMLEKLGTAYIDVLREAEAAGIENHIAEERAFGYDHTDVGAAVADFWDLPIPVAAAIQFHHGPQEAFEGSAVVSLVANVDRIAHAIADGDMVRAAGVVDSATAQFLGLSTEDLSETIETFAEQHGLIEV